MLYIGGWFAFAHNIMNIGLHRMSLLVQNSVVTLVHSPYKIQLELKFLHLENRFACVYEMSLIYITSAPKSL